MHGRLAYFVLSYSYIYPHVPHFLLKNSFFREVLFSRKSHVSLVRFFFCRDGGRQYLFRRICEIRQFCAGIAMTNEINFSNLSLKLLKFFTLNAYIDALYEEKHNSDRYEHQHNSRCADEQKHDSRRPDEKQYSSKSQTKKNTTRGARTKKSTVRGAWAKKSTTRSLFYQIYLNAIMNKI